ncbi:MAG: sulfatase-like hydrolase/transferase [Aliishimia sp.]
MTNLLFVTLDDFFSLSAWPLYEDIAITPNMDALQGSGAHFSSAFADVAVCNPSRAAILTGQTPWQSGVVNNTQDLRQHVDLATETLPGILKSAGVYTVLGGKVFHDFRSNDQDGVADEVLNSKGLRNSDLPEFEAVGEVAYGATDRVLSDDTLVESATAFLNDYDSDTPFALFAGVFRPHIDWIIPQEYLDLYDGIDIPLPDFIDDSDRAEFVQAISRDFHAEVLEAGAWQDLIRHYLASVSYADAKLGELLDGLQQSGHADDTITMVMSDHGYHLGDAEQWHKFTTYEQSARVPLVVTIPGTDPQEITAPVNLSSITATALELMGVEVPASMQPALTPYLDGQTPRGDEFALTWMEASVSVRTADYRYTLYENGDEELFDIHTDIINVDNLVLDLPEVAAALRIHAEDAIIDDLFIRPDGPVSGSAANSVYYFAANPVEIQDAGGIDTVRVSVDYVLPDGIENLEAIDVAGGLTLTGNSGDNRVVGTEDADTLYGLDGNDTVQGDAGNDILYGGAGDDDLSGGTFDDIVYGEDGDDVINGDFGSDLLNGDAGADFLDGGEGEDTLKGGQGDDMLVGGSGNDRVQGGNGADVFIEGHGWDRLLGGGGVDTVIYAGNRADYMLVDGVRGDFRMEGPDGRDTLISIEVLQFSDITMTQDEFFLPDLAQVITGTSGADTIVTNAGADLISGGAGNDTLRARSNDDVLNGGAGDDVLEGGFGADTASYQGASGAVQVSLITGASQGAWGADMLISIEHLQGGEFNDTLQGDGADNRLEGLRGDDVIQGDAGADYLSGARGNDVLSGDAGDDMLIGGLGNDLLNGAEGMDTLQGGQGQDTLFGGQDEDVLVGNADDDLLRGNLGADTLAGGTGNDNLRGGGDNDILHGGLGDDVLFGEDGSDILYGNQGNDVLNGGRGGGQFDGSADVFVFAPAAQGHGGFDRIRDFENGLDQIDLSGFGFSSFADDVLSKATAQNQNADTVLDFGNGYFIYLENFTLSQFEASDVIL